MTEAVTQALEERLARERAARDVDLPAKVRAFAASIREEFDTRPVSREEWDWASGDEG
jgi:antitoxin VapB